LTICYGVDFGYLTVFLFNVERLSLFELKFLFADN